MNPLVIDLSIITSHKTRIEIVPPVCFHRQIIQESSQSQETCAGETVKTGRKDKLAATPFDTHYMATNPAGRSMLGRTPARLEEDDGQVVSLYLNPPTPGNQSAIGIATQR